MTVWRFLADLGRKISAVSGDDRDSTLFSLPAHFSFNPATQLHSAPSELLRRDPTGWDDDV